jgi:hypothetical protein
MSMALSGHDSHTHPARLQRRIYLDSAESVPKRPKPLDSPEFGRAEARDSLTRRAGTREMTAGEAFPSFGSAQVDLPRLNKTCHNLVKGLEFQYESCSTQCIGHGGPPLPR